MGKRKKKVVTLPADTTVTLDGHNWHKCAQSWIYQNPGHGKPHCDSDRIYVNRKENVRFAFLENSGFIVHADVTLKDLRKLIKQAERTLRQNKKFSGCYKHLGNISFYVTKK